MKLSEMDFERMGACMAALVIPVANIMEDEAIADGLRELAKKSKKPATVAQKCGSIIRALGPTLLGKHFPDVVVIASALLDKPEAEIRAANGFAMLQEIAGSFDAELLNFFKSSAIMGRKP